MLLSWQANIRSIVQRNFASLWCESIHQSLSWSYKQASNDSCDNSINLDNRYNPYHASPNICKLTNFERRDRGKRRGRQNQIKKRSRHLTAYFYDGSPESTAFSGFLTLLPFRQSPLLHSPKLEFVFFFLALWPNWHGQDTQAFSSLRLSPLSCLPNPKTRPTSNKNTLLSISQRLNCVSNKLFYFIIHCYFIIVIF